MEHNDPTYNTSSDNEQTTSHAAGSFRSTFRDGTPDDVRDRAKDIVAKGIAAVSGALRGFSEEVQRSDFVNQSRQAIQTAGETVGSSASRMSDEVKNLKEPLKEASQKLTDSVRDLRETAREEIRSTRESLREGHSVTDAEPRTDFRRSALDRSDDYEENR